MVVYNLCLQVLKRTFIVFFSVYVNTKKIIATGSTFANFFLFSWIVFIEIHIPCKKNLVHIQRIEENNPIKYGPTAVFSCGTTIK